MMKRAFILILLLASSFLSFAKDQPQKEASISFYDSSIVLPKGYLERTLSFYAQNKPLPQDGQPQVKENSAQKDFQTMLDILLFISNVTTAFTYPYSDNEYQQFEAFTNEGRAAAKEYKEKAPAFMAAPEY